MTLLSGVVLLGFGYKGNQHLRQLNRQIENREQELMNLSEQVLQQESVDAQYSKVVTKRSTELTREEIHDSLRREIFRLRLKEPNLSESEQEGVGNNRYLVHIPVLREGMLREKGEGYREYQIKFRIPRCTFMQAAEFLKRLEQSNLLLRVDSFELTRSHSSSTVSVMIEVTRTVLSDIEIKSPDRYSLNGGRTRVGQLETSGSGRAVL
jgi:type II secretory pathway component PulM